MKKLDWLPQLVARLVMGCRFGDIGWIKLQLIFPHWNGRVLPGFISILELVGGVSLILGYRTRTAAAILLVILLMHGLPHFNMAYREEMFSLLAFATLLLGLAIQGPGLLSLNK